MMKRLLTAAALTAALLGTTAATAAPPSHVSRPAKTLKGVVTDLIDGTVILRLNLTPEEKKGTLMLPHVTQGGVPEGPGRVSVDKNELYGRWLIDNRKPELIRVLEGLKGGGEVVIEFDSRQMVTKVERAKP